MASRKTSQKTNQTRRKPRWLRGLAILVGIPLSILVIATVAFGYRELRAAQQNRAEIVRLRAAGEPVDNESMAAWFRKQTSTEGTADWNEILSISSTSWTSELTSDLPLLGTGKLPTGIVSGGEWPQEKYVAEYLVEMKPFIDRIHAATKHSTPIWVPIKFAGYGTLLGELQESRSIAWLLELDVVHALYVKDISRAMRSLSSMKGVSEAFDWDLCLLTELVHMALESTHRLAILRSLRTGLWETEQIVHLMDQVGPPADVASRWPESLTGERAMALSTFDDRQAFASLVSSGGRWVSLLFSLPSIRKQVLQDFQDEQKVAAKGLMNLSKRAGEVDARLGRPANGDSVMDFGRLANNLFRREYESYAVAFEQDELTRRLTLTALGVKRFQLEQGRWPNQLNELSSVGLGPNEWNTLYAGSFGYKVDGDQAILWGYEPHKGNQVTDTPPLLDLANDEEYEWYVVVIR